MLTTIAPWRRGVQDRSILAGVQMPPLPLGLMIVQWAALPALRTRPLRFRRVLQKNVHFLHLQLKLDSFHSPRGLNTQNLRVQLPVLHALPSAGATPLY